MSSYPAQRAKRGARRLGATRARPAGPFAAAGGEIARAGASAFGALLRVALTAAGGRRDRRLPAMSRESDGGPVGVGPLEGHPPWGEEAPGVPADEGILAGEPLTEEYLPMETPTEPAGPGKPAETPAADRSRAGQPATSTVEGNWADLLAVISHELRNPMTALNLATHLLEEETKDLDRPELQELSSTASSLARRTSVLIDELLDFTRLESGQLVLARRWVSVVPIVDEALAEVRLARGHALLYRESPDRADLVAFVDPERLRLVLRALLGNAVQHGGSPVCARMVETDSSIDIHVEDSGPGIPPGEREEVFERFRRGPRTGTSLGPGLGLFVCKRLIEQHGGTIGVQEGRGGGADFVVSLPKLPEGGDIPARPGRAR